LEEVIPNHLPVKRSKPAEAFLVRHRLHAAKLFRDWPIICIPAPWEVWVLSCHPQPAKFVVSIFRGTATAGSLVGGAAWVFIQPTAPTLQVTPTTNIVAAGNPGGE
jgi:hypothetical protein